MVESFLLGRRASSETLLGRAFDPHARSACGHRGANLDAKWERGTGKVGFEARIRELVQGRPDLAAIAEALLTVRTVLRQQLDVLNTQLLAVVRADEVCRRLMTIPGV